MKNLTAIVVVAALLAIPSALSATTKGVDITQAGFTPGKVTIDYGDTVTWTNKDTASHQVLADQLAFPTSPVLGPNQTYSYTFTKSGSFGYRDALHTNRRGRSSSAQECRSPPRRRFSRTASPRRCPARSRAARPATR